LKLSGRRRPEPEISLISLIDVLLLIVVFFMLSSTFVTEGRLRVQLPEAGLLPEKRSESAPLVITVAADGSYRVNDRDLVNSGRETLRAAVLAVAGEDRSQRLVLRADGRAQHQAVVTAMDVVGRLGFSRLDVATVEPGTRQ
jgi:biopolymer transport protein ExbD